MSQVVWSFIELGRVDISDYDPLGHGEHTIVLDNRLIRFTICTPLCI